MHRKKFANYNGIEFMDRRTALKLFSVVTSLFPVVASYSNTTKPVKRLALVIGVNKVRDNRLETLTGAASDARKVAKWLEAQGFTAKLFVDQILNTDGTPSDRFNDVTVRQIKDVIFPLLDNEPISELVIYFSGHGYNARGDTDFWLLSNAPRETDEAINFTSLNTAVKKFRIKNVTYIVDACRSTSRHLTVEDLIGSPLFFSPGKTPRIPRSLDTILAATRGEQAYEIGSAIEAHNEGVFTSTFLSAYSRPWLNMIKTVNGKQVVPTRKLTDFLREEIPLRARESNITLEQFPDVQVNADDNYYLGEYTGRKIISFDDAGKYLSSCWQGLGYDKYGDCLVALTGGGGPGSANPPPPPPPPPRPISYEAPTVRDIASIKFDSSLPFETNTSKYSEVQIATASRELGVDMLYDLITPLCQASCPPFKYTIQGVLEG